MRELEHSVSQSDAVSKNMERSGFGLDSCGLEFTDLPVLNFPQLNDCRETLMAVGDSPSFESSAMQTHGYTHGCQITGIHGAAEPVKLRRKSQQAACDKVVQKA